MSFFSKSTGAVTRFIIGMPMAFLGAVIMNGGVSDALNFIVVSIVCTAGVGLVVWIPVTLLAGSITVAIWNSIFRRKQMKELQDQLGSLTSKEKAIMDYKDKASAEGLSDDGIKGKLIEAGWDEEFVTTSLNKINSIKR